jgi:ankyrin repeat protein
MTRIFLYDPYWRAKLWHRIAIAFRRRFRGRIFVAIEGGDDTEALRLATPSVLRRSVGEFGSSPLVAAISARRSELALAFISRGGVYAGDGALAYAANWGDLTVVEALLLAGKNPNEPMKSDIHAGRTPLMLAAGPQRVAIVKRLLLAGANVNAVADDGTTAIMVTDDSSSESLEVLEILCSYRPDIHKRDWRGRSVVHEARDRARNSGKPQMRQILERHFPGTDFEAE